jgi:hypothetical protein
MSFAHIRSLPSILTSLLCMKRPNDVAVSASAVASTLLPYRSSDVLSLLGDLRRFSRIPLTSGVLRCLCHVACLQLTATGGVAIYRAVARQSGAVSFEPYQRRFRALFGDLLTNFLPFQRYPTSLLRGFALLGFVLYLLWWLVFTRRWGISFLVMELPGVVRTT